MVDAGTTTNPCGVGCFVSSSAGHSSTRSRVFEDSRHFNVKELGPCLDRREAGNRHARVSS